ncbi:hypothetical protein TREMEDRAFT_58197 [Tremella mesenterica DSM 1558]|uniref:uncharacterized protein n=1 Tax=Tremella mesenterica (strain ATCC 24925 / CBS 8224 / DSM 1558 / NBRC 9311 / NRRL Y-6157 / RJB 2259-6 / UBC 559-6) TaxID=578456 RepID=UPI0003F49934|nr:uncharacterized protein TREMEDRAFT_58197 [Tremella mesenterica DSM 1558]EIW72048.1 hypothetical protein TREMEDRAFT_58197 [Tremella mesenterica DSM 1558]
MELAHDDEVVQKMQMEHNVADEGAAALQGQSLSYDVEEERRLVRRLDFILLPMMACGTGLQLVDKSALGSAATLTIQKDLGLHGTQYSWAVSIYYFGLLLGTYPANLLLQRYHVGKVVAIAFVCWGAVMLGHAGVHSFGALAAVRFLLGFFESAMAPGFTATTARFYNQTEQPLRYSLWTLANTLFPIPFLLIFFGIGKASDVPLQPWRWIFIMLGILTVFLGVGIWFFFPDKPSTTWWLTERQRAVCVERVAKTQVGIKNTKFKKRQMLEALTDLKVWLICFLLVFQQAGVSLQTNFSGIIIKGFGFSGLKSLLLQIPGWAAASITVIATGFFVTHNKFMQRAKTLVLAAVAVLTVTCGAILYTHPPSSTGRNKALSLVMLTLINTNAVGYPIILSLAGQNFAGSSKKQTVLTMLFVMYCVSNICVPQSFVAKQSPAYSDGILTVMAFQAAHIG